MSKISKSDDEWRKELSELQYRVLREGDTERPFAGEYIHKDDAGTYICAACGNPLFSSDTKFHSGSGWPSFWDVVDQGNVNLRDDLSLGMKRVELLCSNCGGHLGHLFEDGPRDKTGLRYCINSAALEFKPND